MKQVHVSEIWCAASDGACYWAMASCTCTEGWYDAKLLHPTKPCVVVTERTGIPAILLHPKSTADVDEWVVCHFNRWQKGTDFNVQQYFNCNDMYDSSWTAFY